MNKREKEVIQAQLNAEKAVLKRLENQYKTALNDINQKVKLFDYEIKQLEEAINADGLDDAARDVLKSQQRSKVYRKQYQEALKGQISGILDKLHGDEYQTLQQYLSEAYEDAFVGVAYDLAGQGIPLIMPIDQAAAVKAIQTDSKISKGLYTSLGIDTNHLKKTISSEVTRGIATGLSYADMARNISNASNAPLSRAKTIARTEAHRIQQASSYDAQRKAKGKGADVVKQWDGTLDGKTRDTHRKLDGQIREVDEPFEMDGKSAMFPGDFGDPAEDCNCRCVSLTRARWALDEDELKTLQERAEFFGLDKTKNFEEFKSKYLEAAKMAVETDGIDWPKKREPISKEQYKGLMAFAQTNDILLNRFKNFDGDIAVIEDMIVAAKGMVDKYPLLSDGKRKLTIVLNSLAKSVDFAETNGRIININANAFRDITRLAEEYAKQVAVGWFVAGTDYHAIIFHEIGHAVSNCYGIDGMAIAKKITGLTSDAKVLEYCMENLSEYSGSYDDGSEIISECFASVYNSKEKNDFALKFVEECVKIISESRG